MALRDFLNSSSYHDIKRRMNVPVTENTISCLQDSVEFTLLHFSVKKENRKLLL
jgi:hypothetical protein